MRAARFFVLPLALAIALALAPAANAGRTVLGTSGATVTSPFPPTGEFVSGLGGGVPTTLDPDSGLPTAGDLYNIGGFSCFNTCAGENGTSPFQGGFARQMGPDGAHKRVWGYNAVKTGPGDADETQAVRVSASAGTFTVKFGAQVSDPIAYNAGAAVVEEGLNELASIGVDGGSVSVVGGPGDPSGSAPYVVTFDGGPRANTDQPLIVADGSSLTGSVSVYTINPGHTGFEICSAADGDSCQLPKDSGGTSFKEGPIKGTTYSGSLGVFPGPLLVNQVTGELYIRTPLGRINHYSETGDFISAFGSDVVRQGPGDSNVDEVQQLTVTAVSDSYTLSVGQGPPTTEGIPYNATPGQIEAALEKLPEFVEYGGSVSVTGGNPYTITFDGAFGGDAFNQIVISPATAGGVKTLQNGGAPEVCTAVDACKQGAGNTVQPGASVGSGGGLAVAPPGSPNEGNILVGGGGSPSVAEFTGTGEFLGDFGWDVVQSGPNQVAAPDDVQQVTVKADGGTFRLGYNFFFSGLSEQATDPIAFNATAAEVESALEAVPRIGGEGGDLTVTGGPGNLAGSNPYVITFGGSLAGDDVPQLLSSTTGLTITSGTKSAAVTTLTNGGAFEVCRVADGDVCRGGTSGSEIGQFDSSGSGQFSGTVGSLAEASDGTIYTVEGGGNHRVQKFTPAGGGDLTPSLFGVEESQELTVNASAGQFRVSVGGDPDGTTGTGDLTQGSKVITDVNTSTGAFTVGTPIESFGGGFTGLFNTTIVTEVGANTLKVSRPANATKSNEGLRSYLPYATPDLPFNAPAGSVETALNALPSINSGGGSVTVTGGPGGTNPYTIAYHSPALFVDFPDMATSQGATPLSGGSGAGANQAIATTLTDGGPSGRSESDAPTSIGVREGGNVFVAKRFREMDSICPAGFPLAFSLTATRFQEFTPDGLDQVGTSLPCAIEPDYLFDEGLVQSPLGLRIDSIDPVTGVLHSGQTWISEVGTAPQFTLNPISGVTDAGATVSGSIDPNNPSVPTLPAVPAVTRYEVDFRKVGEPEWTRFVTRVPINFSEAPVPFSLGLNGLEPKLDYEVKVLVVKPYGFAPLVQTQTFTTHAGAPRIDAPFSENVTASSVDLRAAVNPSGAETTYRFEYGRTTAYGQSTPAVNIGEDAVPVPVQAHIDGLEPFVYHFRVVATNSEGMTVSPDQTFSFYPEPCPNSAARQQTGATRLPDCRAYELVSPGKMGSVTLAGGRVAPYASNPARFSFSSVLGVLPGPWNPPNAGNDTYVATRTSSGWETHYVGVQIDEIGDGGTLEADLSLDRFLQHSLNTDRTGPSSAPYVFDSEGNPLGRLPTNLDQIPGGDAPTDAGGFVGDQLFSGDGHHFFYSSVNVPLAPGGLTSGAGSVYHNDIESQTVEIVSKTEAGADIPPVPGAGNFGRFLFLPGASRDGSHLLIAAPAACTSSCPRSPAVLYMWVDGVGSFDVSEGRAVQFEGMSADGSKVFFTTDKQMPGTGDTDKSIDLYMWNDASDSLTRVSAGGGGPVGNTDACNAEWASDCDVEFVDRSVAPDNGSAYFFSPEQLVGSDGFPGRRNLYLYRDGALHFVGSLEAASPINLIQASADGHFGAFITRSRLTSYDNTGVGESCTEFSFGKPSSPRCKEMYLYDAQTDVLVCASCERTGAHPSHHVEASDYFLSDDGRVFFATREPLIPADTDGFTDVYEYVGSVPQLITTGVASQEKGGVGNAGLVGVSADGLDVYFSTLETLAPQDENGPFMKFYDARINGGFPVSAQIQPCAAADECHGPDSTEPQAPRLASQANLGDAGDVTPARKRCARKSKAAKGKRKAKQVKRCHSRKRNAGAKRRAGK